MFTPLAFEFAAFSLGLLLGSFLNVCISRLPHYKSISKPRSHCPNCQTTIGWYDNIPLLSWILLRARCRHCNKPISWRYPAVELAMGLWMLIPGAELCRETMLSQTSVFPLILSTRYHLSTGTFYFEGAIGMIGIAILGFLLIGLLVMDWQTQTLPDAFTLTGIAIGFVLICCQAVFLGPVQDEMLLQGRNPLTSPGNVTDRGNVILTGPEHLVLGRLLAIVLAGGILFLIGYVYRYIRQRDGLGLGDAKLAAMIAAFLGFWPAVLALFLGFVLCSVYALTLMARGKATLRARLPLGTFLCIGGLIAGLVGTPVIAWYTSLL
jgi:leader peptidase (prepilin peptidase)/N-methyltransferase